MCGNAYNSRALALHARRRGGLPTQRPQIPVGDGNGRFVSARNAGEDSSQSLRKRMRFLPSRSLGAVAGPPAAYFGVHDTVDGTLGIAAREPIREPEIPKARV